MLVFFIIFVGIRSWFMRRYHHMYLLKIDGVLDSYDFAVFMNPIHGNWSKAAIVNISELNGFSVCLSGLWTCVVTQRVHMAGCSGQQNVEPKPLAYLRHMDGMATMSESMSVFMSRCSGERSADLSVIHLSSLLGQSDRCGDSEFLIAFRAKPSCLRWITVETTQIHIWSLTA